MFLFLENSPCILFPQAEVSCRKKKPAEKSSKPIHPAGAVYMQRLMPEPIESAAPPKRRVVAVYENNPAREHALRFCDDLAGKPSDLDIHWCAFNVLRDPQHGTEAANRAATADMILFAVTSEGDLPGEVKLWIERWLNRRGEREGALVGLVMDRPDSPFEIATRKEIYLRHTARRAQMDYLSHENPTPRKAMPDSLDSFSQRADEMTSVLDQILQTRPIAPPIL